MKHLTSYALLLVAASLITETSLVAKKKPVPPASATITVSPSVYVAGTPISFVGSGFGAWQAVSIEIQGPMFHSIYSQASNKGDLSVNLPGGLNLESGSYGVTAFQSNGLTASTGFEVQ
jgi:hypothetical protein